MQPTTPPARAQKIPRVMGPVEKAIRLENTTRVTATRTEDFWKPILSIFPPQIGLRIKFEKAPPMRIIPAVEPDTLNSSRATTATNTLIPMGPAATIKVANPMRITFRSNRFLNDGMSTLIGTAPNIVFSAFMQDTYGVEISMFDWMMLGVPLAAIMLFGAWMILTRYIFPIHFNASTEARNELKTMLVDMGSFTKDEKRISIIFGLAVFAWVTRTLLNKIDFLSGLTDAGIAIIAAILIFMTPSASKKGDLLQWERSKDLPWGLLILFGGRQGCQCASWSNNHFI